MSICRYSPAPSGGYHFLRYRRAVAQHRLARGGSTIVTEAGLSDVAEALVQQATIDGSKQQVWCVLLSWWEGQAARRLTNGEAGAAINYQAVATEPWPHASPTIPSKTAYRALGYIRCWLDPGRTSSTLSCHLPGRGLLLLRDRCRALRNACRSCPFAIVRIGSNWLVLDDGAALYGVNPAWSIYMSWVLLGSAGDVVRTCGEELSLVFCTLFFLIFLLSDEYVIHST